MQRSNCNCPINALQRIAGRLNQDTLPIDNILQIGAELTGDLTTIIHCERCITRKRMTNMLSQITSRLVSFYEAAFLSAAASLTIATRSRSTKDLDVLWTPTLSHDCETSRPLPTMQGAPGCQSLSRDMKLGKLPIDGSEARLLVEVVLVDACLDLNEKIQEWKLVMDELLEVAEEQYDEVICHCLDRLAKLIGLLQFHGLSVERS
ncbi:hypothetical protein DL767_006755 [Monosporascus sp. MG133]|nr:hypothetical protein DL767_006755 [Monosporascus sp. MG133]